jgi:hypothetical protein
VASLGVQVHGGMGFIEETGAAQYLRDAKILTIYEGTTAIQANDLVGRKTARDGGQVARAIADRIETTEAQLQRGSAASQTMAKRLGAARKPSWTWWTSLRPDQGAAQRRVRRQRALPDAGGHGVAGWQMARALMAAEDQLAAGEDTDFMKAKIATARFYGDHILNKVQPVARQHHAKAPIPSPPCLWRPSDGACPQSCSACRCPSSARRCSSSATPSW